MCKKWDQRFPNWCLLNPHAHTHEDHIALKCQCSPSGPDVPKVCCSSDTRNQQARPSPHGREETPLWKTELGLSQPEFLHLSTLPTGPYSKAYQHSQHPETLGSSYACGKTDPTTSEKSVSKELSINGELQQYHHGGKQQLSSDNRNMSPQPQGRKRIALHQAGTTGEFMQM